MPKVLWAEELKKNKAEVKLDEMDWLMAVLRYRRTLVGISFDELGRRTGMSGPYLKNLFNDLQTSPWQWPTETRNKICDELGLGKEIRKYCYMG